MNDEELLIIGGLVLLWLLTREQGPPVDQGPFIVTSHDPAPANDPRTRYADSPPYNPNPSPFGDPFGSNLTGSDPIPGRLSIGGGPRNLVM